MSKTISTTGLNLIKKYEGCKLTAYQDSVGVWTIGYGHTSGVTSGMTITQAQADSYLKSDCATAEKNVNSFDSKYSFTQAQFDALVSFAYNIGSINQLTANGTRSTTEISAKFTAYNKAGGKVLAGLTKRREDEKALFDSSSTTTTTSTTSSNALIKLGQQHANNFAQCGLTCDGICGSNTNLAKGKVLQRALNLDYKAGLTEDGKIGTTSKTKLGSHYIAKGESQYMVTAAEILMYLNGIDPNGVECPGTYGNGLVTAAKTKFGGTGTKITASNFLTLVG